MLDLGVITAICSATETPPSRNKRGSGDVPETATDRLTTFGKDI